MENLAMKGYIRDGQQFCPGDFVTNIVLTSLIFRKAKIAVIATELIIATARRSKQEKQRRTIAQFTGIETVAGECTQY